MNKKDIVWKLAKMSDSKMSAIIDNAVQAYFYILLDIVRDIYDSCIEDYYNGYTPLYYDRHGNIEGFNLYGANSSAISDGYLHIYTDSSKLEPYKGVDSDVILYGVEHGKRGGPAIKGWPKRWSTSYPNSYSDYNVWYSKGSTIESILEDFSKNGITGTFDLLWKCIEKFI
jgi:hypothetical protein